jgi:hypothetical protein
LLGHALAFAVMQLSLSQITPAPDSSPLSPSRLFAPALSPRISSAFLCLAICPPAYILRLVELFGLLPSLDDGELEA